MSEIVDQFRAQIDPPKPQASWLSEGFYLLLAFLMTFMAITFVFEQIGLGDFGFSNTLYRGYKIAKYLVIPNEYEQEARIRAAAEAQAEEDAKLDGKWFAPVKDEPEREPLTAAEMAFPALFVIVFGYIAFSLFFRDATHKVDTGAGAQKLGGGMGGASRASRSAKAEKLSSGSSHGSRKGGAVEKGPSEDRLAALLKRRREDRSRPAA